MRRALLTVVLTGCGRLGFDEASASTDGPVIPSCVEPATLRACFAFDGTARDDSGNGNDGGGAVSYGPGHRGLAAQFDASSNLRLADSASLDIADALTVMAWIRIDTLPTSGRSVLVDRNLGFSIYLDPTGRLAGGVLLAVNMTATSAGTLPLGTWQHIAMTYDGAMVRVWIDGVVAGTMTGSGAIQTSDTTGTRIGGNLPDPTNMNNEPFLGAIDELGEWSTALPASTICAEAGSC